MKPRRRARWLVGVIAATVGMALAHTWIRLRALDLGYQIADETRQLEEFKQSERRLQIEVAFLRSPARLEREARRLGMRVPDADEVRRVRLHATPGRKGVGAP
jgi:cell division protein FtsL